MQESDQASPRKVSVVVPTRDRPALLREALASIRALEGDDLVFEIIVGDNGSDSETAIVVSEFDGVHLKTDRNGAAAARNIAMAAATGEFIAFLDDDDLWQETHIRPQIALLDKEVDVDCVLGQVTLTDHKRRHLNEPSPEDPPPEGDFVREMLQGWFPQIGSTVARATVRDTIGFFDEVLLGDQDWDWHLRLARSGRIAFVPVPGVLFRSRPDGTFDALQRRRVRFTRKVFLRHAWPERGRWRSPKSWISSYYYCFKYYYAYFAEAAERRAESGRPFSALYSALTAIWLFPRMACKDLFQASPLRSALGAMIGRSDNKSQGTAGT